MIRHAILTRSYQLILHISALESGPYLTAHLSKSVDLSQIAATELRLHFSNISCAHDCRQWSLHTRRAGYGGFCVCSVAIVHRIPFHSFTLSRASVRRLRCGNTIKWTYLYKHYINCVVTNFIASQPTLSWVGPLCRGLVGLGTNPGCTQLASKRLIK